MVTHIFRDDPAWIKLKTLARNVIGPGYGMFGTGYLLELLHRIDGPLTEQTEHLSIRDAMRLWEECHPELFEGEP